MKNQISDADLSKLEGRVAPGHEGGQMTNTIPRHDNDAYDKAQAEEQRIESFFATGSLPAQIEIDPRIISILCDHEAGRISFETGVERLNALTDVEPQFIAVGPGHIDLRGKCNKTSKESKK